MQTKRSTYRVKTASIYAPEAPDAGLRVLVMRYWPRGIKKERVDLWLRGLGPSAGLIKEWKAGAMSWAAFKRAYMAEFKDEARKSGYEELIRIVKDAKAGVTLLCACADDERCHRRILREMAEKR
ncbi:MAG: DUF488 family protein [Deltaproteobacteria bacterium]|nr:DUF488 family protein [Deltaproteobacteria bacterium]